MKRRLLFLLSLVLLVVACGPARLTLPRAPEAGWKAYGEDQAGGVAIRLPAAWRVVDPAHRPTVGEIADLKAAGDPMATYLETMTTALNSGTFTLEAVDPATVSAAIPFATSTYLSYVPGIRTAPPPVASNEPGASPAGIPSPENLLDQNLAATVDLYKLQARPVVRAINPPTGFEYGWEIEYSWTATKGDKSAQARLAGLHYLLLRDDDAWILGFTTMIDRGRDALPVWRQIGGSITAPSLPLSPLIWAALAGVALALAIILALAFLIRRRVARARALAALPRRRGHQRPR